MVPEHFVSRACLGEKCVVCEELATHKICEEPLHGDDGNMGLRAAYMCCSCFCVSVGQPLCSLRNPLDPQTDGFWVGQTLEIVRQLANGKIFSLTIDNHNFRISMAEDMALGVVRQQDGEDVVGTFNSIRLEHLHSWVKGKHFVVIPD